VGRNDASRRTRDGSNSPEPVAGDFRFGSDALVEKGAASHHLRSIRDEL
jgi:hypothetical protein